MNGPSASGPSISASRMGVCRQPVSTSACSVTFGCSPRVRRSRKAAPSAFDTVHTTVVGSSDCVSPEGLPHTGETHISCRCSCGLICTWPTAPACEARAAWPGLAMPSVSTIAPRRSRPVKSASSPSPT